MLSQTESRPFFTEMASAPPNSAISYSATTKYTGIPFSARTSTSSFSLLGFFAIREQCHELFTGDDSHNFFSYGIRNIMYEFWSSKETKASSHILQRDYLKICDRNNIQIEDYFCHKFSNDLSKVYFSQ